MANNEEEKQFYIITDDLQNKVKWITGTKYSFEIPEGFQEHAQLKRWCEENCNDKVVYEENKIYHSMLDDIYFYNEEDAAAYKLRWT